MILVTILALFYYVRAVHSVWLGSSEELPQKHIEPRLAAGILVVLVAAAILLGAVPGLVDFLIEGSVPWDYFRR